jgi:predicted RNA binding protein YcfA (HicA-like mRNA interferase family)
MVLSTLRRMPTRTLNSRRLRRALLAAGCVVLRESGSHAVILFPNGRKVTLPLGHREVYETFVIRACRDGGVPYCDLLARY